MDKKYVAAIMNKKSLGSNDYVFYCEHVAVGRIDESNQNFIDEEGNVFVPMASPSFLLNQDILSYFFLLDFNDYEKTYHLDSKEALSKFLKEFEILSKRKFFYLGRNKKGQAYLATFDKDEVCDRYERDASHSLEKDVRYGDNYLIDLELDQLLREIQEGRYSREELFDVVERLEISDGKLEALIDMIYHQILGAYLGENKPVKKVEKKSDKETFSSEKIDIEDLYKKVTKTLIAQEEPARRVIVEIARKEMDARKKKEGILLMGPTGVGKTELMRLIAKYIDRPFFKVDSTQLTMPGYVGKDIEEVLWDLYVACGEDLEKAEKAIVFFDEVDKKGSANKSDVSGQGVLNLLLPFIEGATYDACLDTKYSSDKVKIATDNMTVILGGAYTDVYKGTAKHDLGFLKEDTGVSQNNSFSTKSFVEYGKMTDEFMSRVTVVRLNDLDVDAIKRIMLESDESAIRIQQDIFKKLGVKLTFTDGYTTRVAQNAYDRKTGARGLNGIIDESTWKAFEEVYSHPKRYKEVILDENTVEDSSQYQLVKKRK